MLLSEIPKYINCKKIYNNKKKDISFNFISTNSKYIKKKSILIVDNKNKFKEDYIYEAINKGAVALITNNYFSKIKIPQYLVKNNKTNLKILLQVLKKNPPKNIIGITGTNGKTSVVWNISSIAKALGRNVKSYGTLGYYKNLKKIENSYLTTPEYEILYQKMYTSMQNNKYDFVFEVSSHALSKKRIGDIKINIAALTNISHEHLDFHKTIDNYRNTKFKLFFRHLAKNGIAVLNDKIDKINNLKKKLNKKNITIYTYGKKNSDIYIMKENKKTYLKVFNKKYNINLKKYNNFELENLLCSIACSLALGIKKNNIIKIISKLKKPEGRFQEIGRLNNDSRVIVDYAHTPEALQNILIASNLEGKKPNVLFGCGGNRDKNKRKKMGHIANMYASKVYVTDDNPRNENPSLIRKSIIAGCPSAIEIVNRRQAIYKAIDDLEKKSTLVIAGKGHEKVQIIKNKTKRFDDAQIALEYLKKKKLNTNTKSKDLFYEVQNYLIKKSNKIRINSKDIAKGDVFVALKGSSNHGMKYIEDAFKKGAKYAITNKISKLKKNKKNILLVNNSEQYLMNIAKFKRALFNGKVIGITGSVGKTSVKENLKFLISKVSNVSASIKSYNNYLGVIISLINMKLSDQFSIFELGTNNFNEISKLTNLVKPTQVIITNIYPTHLDNLKNTRNIAKEKSDIFNPKFNPKTNLLIISNTNKDEFFIYKKAIKIKIPNIYRIGTNKNDDYSIKKIETINKNLFNVLIKSKDGNKKILTNSNLNHYINNIIICLIIFKYNKLNLNYFFDNLKFIPKVEGRGLKKLINFQDKKITFIDESYNASPETMKNCINYFANIQTKKNQKKFLILGDMNELGTKSKIYHQKIINSILDHKFDNVILCGEIFKLALNDIKIINKRIKYMKNENEIINFLKLNLHNNDILLIKCSNVTKINNLAKILIGKKE